MTPHIEGEAVGGVEPAGAPGGDDGGVAVEVQRPAAHSTASYGIAVGLVAGVGEDMVDGVGGAGDRLTGDRSGAFVELPAGGGVLRAAPVPGGSATASEAIRTALQRLAAKKPVVFSMGELAASGGYIAAIAADNLDYPVIGDFFYVARGRQVFLGLRANNPLRAGEFVPLVQKIGARIPGTIPIAQQSSLFERGLISYDEALRWASNTTAPDTTAATTAASTISISGVSGSPAGRGGLGCLVQHGRWPRETPG